MISFNKTIDDGKIMEGLQSAGNRRWFYEKELYTKYFYFIGQGIQKYNLREDEAASAYSDTIIILIENVVNNKFEERSSLKSYAFQIFSNKCVDLIRKKTTNKSSVDKTSDIDSTIMMLPDKTRSAIQVLMDKNRQSVLMQKLNEIGEKCKTILSLNVDGYSDKEIAEMMDYTTADVVKTSRLRCLKKLKEKVVGSSRYE